MKNIFSFVLIQLMLFPFNSFALGCKFDSALIGQIKRNLPSFETGQLHTTGGIVQELVLEIDNNAGEVVMFSGHKVLASSWGVEAKGYMLVLPGNAQQSQSIAVKLLDVAAYGIDVYVASYRGMSEGEDTPNLETLFADALSVITALKQTPDYSEKKFILYGISSGGIIALQSHSIAPENSIVILDSVPDKLPMLLFCDRNVHPMNAIEMGAARNLNFHIIRSDNDRKVRPLNSRRLGSKIENFGGEQHTLKSGTHPFEEDDDVGARIALIYEILNSEAGRE